MPIITRRNTRIPGTIWNNHGFLYWRGKLPGDSIRKSIPLCMPGSTRAMTADHPQSYAVAAAWRLWESAVRESRTVRNRTPTVGDICDRYIIHCETYYSQNGAQNERIAIRLFREMYGPHEIGTLTHADMIALRDAHISSGICRRTVNDRMTSTKRMIAWALDEALIPACVKAELSQVSPLKRGRSEAPECDPIRPARDEDIELLRGVLTPSLFDMVTVHRHTGMRPGELCAMRWSDIERRSNGPWVYRPKDHKNAWRRRPRPILIGPISRRILEKYTGGDYCFSPARSMTERCQMWRELRKSHVQPSQIDRSSPEAMRKPGECWDPGTYARATRRAFASLGVDGFSPNQLRHAFATDVRRRFGLTACRAVLGHSGGQRVTDIYTRDAVEDEIISQASMAVETLG